MKTVFIKDNTVIEIIPDYALPVEKWYGAEFASQCVEAPDDVKQGMIYDPITKAFLMQSTEPTLAEVQTAKLAEINAACTSAIEAGCDVTLSDGTAGHISLSIPDQINLSTAQEAIKAGGTGYAYHLDGALCEVYPAADIAIMAQAATAHVLYHQTYCNHVRAWVKRCTAIADVQAITYGAELPDDLKAHMATVLGGGNA